MLKVSPVLIDEVPDQGVYIIFSPSEPILDRGFDIPDRPAIKLSRIHLVHLIALAMLTAVDGSEDDGIGVKVMAVEFPAIGQFKDSLPNLKGSTVNLVKEQADRLLTSNLEPVRRIEGRAIAFDAGQTDKISLSHLAGTPLNDRQAGRSCQLINHLGFSDAVTTTKKNRKPGSADGWGKAYEGFEVHTHLYSLHLSTV
jgi:hypothetical protein